MKIFYRVILAILFSQSARAGFENSVGFATRTYPLAMSFVGEFAYKNYFWGSDKTLLNGYAKPSLRVTTIGLANSARVELELAPVNIFSFYGGGAVLQNNSNLTGINCDIFSCQGNWTRSFLAMEARFGVGKLAATSKFSKYWVSYTNPSNLWIDPVSNLVFRSSSVAFQNLESILVYRDSEKWIYGLMSEVSWKENQADMVHDSQYLFARYNPEPYSFVLGLGRYNAQEYLPGFSAFGYAKYVF